jgi:hypothetical protein
VYLGKQSRIIVIVQDPFSPALGKLNPRTLRNEMWIPNPEQGRKNAL